MRDYANTDVLTSTGWAKQNLDNRRVCFVECSHNLLLYGQGHIPGAVQLDWDSDLTDSRGRDLVSGQEFEALMGRLGIGPDTTVVLYGDRFNMMACYAYWVLWMNGHERLMILDGGRKEWVAQGLPLVREITERDPVAYTRRRTNRDGRARRDDVLEHIGRPDAKAEQVKIPAGHALVDDRTPDEFNGIFRETDDYPQRYLRGGHIPGAVNLPWVELVTLDGTFKPADEIERLLERRHLSADQKIVVYTRIGERAALTWFVLHELMGFRHVRLYDGSWTEWGNLVGMPIAKLTRPERSLRQARASVEADPVVRA